MRLLKQMVKQLAAVIKQPAAILRGIVDEISDQTAYRRHLAAHGARHSGTEWRKFCDQRWEAQARRAKCC